MVQFQKHMLDICCFEFYVSWNKTVHPVETVHNIWVVAVRTLKGQYDDLISHEPSDRNARLSFLAHW
jgi:hypothetical protein